MHRSLDGCLQNVTLCNKKTSPIYFPDTGWKLLENKNRQVSQDWGGYNNDKVIEEAG